MESFSDFNVASGIPLKTHDSILKRCYNCFVNQLKNLAPFIVIVIYSLVGAWIFMALEHDNDLKEFENKKRRVEQARNSLYAIIYNMLNNGLQVKNQSVLIVEAIQKFEEGIQFSIRKEESVWDFYSAILYAGAVYTTIGYGNLVCKTTSGRITTIFYAIVGIPLTLSVLNQLGNILLSLMTKVTFISNRIFCSCCGKKQKRVKQKQSAKIFEKNIEAGMFATFDPDLDFESDIEKTPGEFRTEENNPPVLAAVISMISWLFICAGIFCFWESWDYFTSFYFFFVSLTTIGFGDIVPDYPQYMIMNFGLVFIGLALVSVTVNVVQEKLEDVYMSLLAALLNEYMSRLSEGDGGLGANVGMIKSWTMNKKAKFLLPLLSKGKRKLVMQRFQDEAKAQGIELPPTLTDINPGTGLPNILTIDKEKDAVQYIEQKENELEALTRSASQFSRRPTVQTQNRGSVHVPCQTWGSNEQINLDERKRQSMVEFKLREACSQTDIQRGLTAAMEIQTYSSLSLLRDSGSQTFAKTTKSRLSQTSMSGWRLREVGSQTLVSPTPRRCTESQTNLVQTIEHGLQHGVTFFSMTSIGSQTHLDQDHAYVQTNATPTQLRDEDSQTILDWSEASNQTPLSFFALREAESQTTLEAKVDSVAQTRPSETSHISCQTRQSMYGLRESQSQTNLETQETPVQTRQSAFDIRDSQAQTQNLPGLDVTIQTPVSYFEMRQTGSQTIYNSVDEALQTFVNVDETGSQIEAETFETWIQVGQSFFHLRTSESQTRLDITERDTQTWNSGIRFSQAESQTAIDQRESQAQTSAISLSEHSTQTALAILGQIPTSGVVGTTSKMEHLTPKALQTESSSATSSPSTTPPMAPTFKQISLQKMPAKFKRQKTFDSMATTSDSENKVIFPRPLRKVQDTPQSSRKSQENAGESEKLPRVRALATQFEKRRISQPQVDLGFYFPLAKGSARSTTPVTRKNSKNEDQEDEKVLEEEESSTD